MTFPALIPPKSLRSWRPVVITTNPVSGRQYRMAGDTGRQWFSHENPADGSGFGYLSWTLRRRVGFTYQDIGYGFPVELWKGPYRPLFSGQIVKITERTGSAGDQIEVWASGWLHTLSADTFNRVYCDNRWQKWKVDETPATPFRPDLFDTNLSNRLYLKPKKGSDFVTGDYTKLRYTFPFGESAVRLIADYDLALPDAFPATAEIRDADGNILWTASVTGTGVIDVLAVGISAYFEIRLYVTADGECSADSDTVYLSLTNVYIYSLNVATLDASVVAKDLVSVLSEAEHGLSDDLALIQPTRMPLAPCYFDRDMTLLDVIKWCCQFGDIDGNAVLFGVEMDDSRRFVLKPQDTTTIRYIVARKGAELERAGDWGESAQVVYGIYTDAQNMVQRTVDYEVAAVVADLGGYLRRQGIQIQGMTDLDLLQNALELWLSEKARPGSAGTFTVKNGVRTPDGRFVPYDEIQPGGLVQVREWRAVNATLSPQDYRDNMTTFVLAGVRVDEANRAVELIPRESSDLFVRYMAIVTQMTGG